jgi:hypothetical protein
MEALGNYSSPQPTGDPSIMIIQSDSKIQRDWLWKAQAM